jgi:hypothetical protein
MEERHAELKSVFCVALAVVVDVLVDVPSQAGYRQLLLDMDLAREKGALSI